MKKNHFFSHLAVVRKINVVKSTRKKETIVKNVRKYKLELSILFIIFYCRLDILYNYFAIAYQIVGILGIESLNLHIQ